ncbi:MAG: OmpA family protein, partial [Myxococcales bacterium]|nr:OmpA family protein [Myxococcales bacterium]
PKSRCYDCHLEHGAVDNVFVVSDASGTMYEGGSFPEAKALARSFVASMPEADGDGYWASSIGFGGDDRLVWPLAPFDRELLAGHTEALELLGSIDGRGGLSPLHDVLKEISAALALRSGRAAIVIFSDGLPDAPKRALATAEALIAARSGEVCIHAVQSRDDFFGEAFLMSLTQLTDCGSLRLAANLTSPAQFMALTHSVFVGGAPSVGISECSSNPQLPALPFEVDRAEITPQSSAVLDTLVDHLSLCENVRVRIDGHTDQTGTDSYNRALSERRSRAAHRYLIEAGITPGRLTVRGFGAADPIAPNGTEEGRALNRRVDLLPIR